MSKTIFLVYDDYNSNLYDHADYIGTITAHGGSGCKALRTGIKIIEVRIDDKDISDADNMILEIMEDDDNEQTV